MSVESLIIAAVMTAVGLAIIALPLLTRKNRRDQAQQRQLERTRAELITSYERVLATIRDLDEDFGAEKINPEDYEIERQHWTTYGVRLLQLLEDGHTEQHNGHGAEDSATVSREGESELDLAVEEAIRNYRDALHSANNQ